MVRREEIEALILLMDDPDPEVREAVAQRLNALGEDAVPLLDEFQSQTRDAVLKAKLTAVMHTLTIRSLEQEFLNYLDDGIKNLEDLEHGLFLLARFGTPTLRTELYVRKLDAMADELRLRLDYYGDPIEHMFMLLEYLFKEEGYRGNESEYFDPANSYLNVVMDRKRGLPISLALLVLFLSRRLDLAFQGVNMPLHFLLRYDCRGETFFIDAFNGGVVVKPEQCRGFLLQNGIEPTAAHFLPAEPADILARCMRNLINGYEKTGDAVRELHMKRWLRFLELVQANAPR
jgi:regulator of sirC expression with transglutaminase-like and TPR domain